MGINQGSLTARITASVEPPAAQPRHDSFFLDKPVFRGQKEDAALNTAASEPLQAGVNGEENSRSSFSAGDAIPFARQIALQDLFEESEDESQDNEGAASNLAPVSSLFKASEYSLRRCRKRPQSQTNRASNPDLDNYPRLTFTSRGTPSPAKVTQRRRKPYVDTTLTSVALG